MGARKEQESPSLPEGLVDAAGMKYLAQRPSFVRLAKRVALKGFTLTRDQYRLLMIDVKSLESLLKLTKVDREAFDVQKYTVNKWGKDNWQVKAHLKPKPKPGETPIQPAVPRTFPTRSSFPGNTGVDKLVLPDMHFGFYRTPTGECIPTHDERAISIYLSVAYEYQPSTIVILGDLIDLPTLGKWVQGGEFNQLVDYAKQAAYEFLAALRDACPNARIVYVEGNHEKRLREYMRRLAPELANVTRAGETDPVLSITNLLRLRDLGVEYIGEYGEHFWFDPRTPQATRVLHGELIGSSGGLTVAKMLVKYPRVNSMCGHVHRAELAFVTEHLDNGDYETYWAMSPGTGARLDGVVPGERYPDWQNAFGLVWKGNHPSVHVIQNGEVHIAGRTIKVQE